MQHTDQRWYPAKVIAKRSVAATQLRYRYDGHRNTNPGKWISITEPNVRLATTDDNRLQRLYGGCIDGHVEEGAPPRLVSMASATAACSTRHGCSRCRCCFSSSSGRPARLSPKRAVAPASTSSSPVARRQHLYVLPMISAAPPGSGHS